MSLLLARRARSGAFAVSDAADSPFFGMSFLGMSLRVGTGPSGSQVPADASDDTGQVVVGLS